jgi:hypothetical protein
MVFRGENDGRDLGREPYIAYLAARISEAKRDGAISGGAKVRSIRLLSP